MLHKECCFIGHRKINITEELILYLRNLIERLIVEKHVHTFLFGSRSEFNDLCHTIVSDLKIKYTQIKRIMYPCKSEACTLEHEREKYEKMFSNVLKKEVRLLGFEEEREFKTKYTAGKASYVERNYAMIDDSNYCVFYTTNSQNSGAFKAMQYAIRKKKEFINVANASE